MKDEPKVEYIERWKNGRAIILINGHQFVLYRAIDGGPFGNLPDVYRACKDGRDQVNPSRKLSVLLRRLARLAR